MHVDAGLRRIRPLLLPFCRRIALRCARVQVRGSPIEVRHRLAGEPGPLLAWALRVSDLLQQARHCLSRLQVADGVVVKCGWVGGQWSVEARRRRSLEARPMKMHRYRSQDGGAPRAAPPHRYERSDVSRRAPLPASEPHPVAIDPLADAGRTFVGAQHRPVSLSRSIIRI